MIEMAPSMSPVRDDMVTASDLVRQFGTWRERAARSPVYILHRGRPRLVLASVAVMDALCRPLDDGGEDARRLAALLDGSPEMIVVVDRMLRITATSRSVRARFADKAVIGGALAGLVPPHVAPFLAQVATRVAESAIAESVELPLIFAPDRLVALMIEPHPDGIVLFGRDVTDAEALRRADDDRRALDLALSASHDAALARINLRGYLDGPHPALSALTGIAADTLAAIRLVTLFTVQSRVLLGDAIEAVTSDGNARAVNVALLINRGDARPVTVALAPSRRGPAIEGAVALILATS